MIAGTEAHKELLEARKNQLAEDLKNVIRDAEELLKATVDSGADEFYAARAGIEERMNRTISSLRIARRHASRTIRCAAESSRNYAYDNRWAIAGVAALGIVVATALNCRSSPSQRG